MRTCRTTNIIIWRTMTYPSHTHTDPTTEIWDGQIVSSWIVESITAFNFLVCWISLYFILKSSRVILLQNLHLFMLIWPTFLYCIASSSGQRRHWLHCRPHYFLIYAACYLTNDVNIKAWWFLRPPDKSSLAQQPPGRGPDVCPDMRCC